MAAEVSTLLAFFAGVVSFLSPCVLPLVPGYVSYVSGFPLGDLQETRNPPRLRVLVAACLFILGFSLVFMAMGASASFLGSLITRHLGVLSKAAGVLIVLFGLYKLGLLPLRFLMREKRFQPAASRRGMAAAPFLGAAFAFGWTPCVGPILGAVLGYASVQASLGKGTLLLAAYSAGLAIPFLATALAVGGFLRLFKRLKNHLGLIEKISGGLMVALGLLMVSGNMTWFLGHLTFLNRFAL